MHHMCSQHHFDRNFLWRITLVDFYDDEDIRLASDDEWIEALGTTKDDENHVNNDDTIDINGTMSSLSTYEDHNKVGATTITSPANKETISSPNHEMS